MSLATYLSAERGRSARLANAVGLSLPFLSQMVTGARKVPPERCPSIERATNGEVRCEDLRSDVTWLRVPDPGWPHPAGRPCIDVANAV